MIQVSTWNNDIKVQFLYDKSIVMSGAKIGDFWSVFYWFKQSNSKFPFPQKISIKAIFNVIKASISRSVSYFVSRTLKKPNETTSTYYIKYYFLQILYCSQSLDSLS